MTLRGIDISNWQSDMNLPAVLECGIDFCICKATEGTNFIDFCCDGFIQDCIKKNALFGYYHFAGIGSAKDEARFFWNNTLGYSGHGIPVLDYESWNIDRNHIAWCEKFMHEYHDLSGVWPLLYISASHCPDFANSWIPSKCGLWVAGYNKEYPYWAIPSDMEYDVSPWEFAAIWQFSSTFTVDHYNFDLDANLAFMDAAAWSKYAGMTNFGQTAKAVKQDTKKAKTCEQLAQEVIDGKWGNGWNRKNALDAAYGKGTYDHVQTIVNNLLGLDGC